jgi:hypothetical protein
LYSCDKQICRYDFEIKEITRREIKGTLLVGKNHAKLENCTVKFNDEIMKIEKPTLLTERTENWDEAIPLSEFSNGFFFSFIEQLFLREITALLQQV